MNNTNLHCFQVIADYRSDFRFRQGVPLFNAFVRDNPLNFRPRKLAEENKLHCVSKKNIPDVLAITLVRMSLLDFHNIWQKY